MSFEKLTSILKTLDKKALARLDLYIQSPYFNTPKPAAELFSYIKAVPRSYPPKYLEVQLLAKHSPLLSNAGKQAQAGTALLKTIVEFIAAEEWQGDTRQQQLQKLKGLKKHHQFGLYKDYLAKIEHADTPDVDQDIDSLHYHHLLEEIKHTGFDIKHNRNAQNKVTVLIDSLDKLYAIKKIRYLCEAYCRKEWFGTEYENDANTEALIKSLNSITNQQNPYVYVFINIYRMLIAPTFAEGIVYYNSVKECMKFSLDDEKYTILLSEVWYYTVNFCLAWNAKGYTEAGLEYMWWIELRIRNGLLLDKDKIQAPVFRNIVSIAAKSGYSADWISEFIDRYKDNLPTELSDGNIAYALGVLNYHRGNYQEALYQFNYAEAKSEPILNCIIRGWLFMCSYSYRKDDSLDAILFSYEKYIQRNQQHLHSFKSIFAKFISYSKRLLKVSTKEEKKKLYALLEQEDFFAGKDWLLTQIKT